MPRWNAIFRLRYFGRPVVGRLGQTALWHTVSPKRPTGGTGEFPLFGLPGRRRDKPSAFCLLSRFITSNQFQTIYSSAFYAH